jgi:hypothetical protein
VAGGNRGAFVSPVPCVFRWFVTSIGSPFDTFDGSKHPHHPLDVFFDAVVWIDFLADEVDMMHRHVKNFDDVYNKVAPTTTWCAVSSKNILQVFVRNNRVVAIRMRFIT